jgi:hypothetical protein
VGWEIVTNSITNSEDKVITVSCTAGPNNVLGGGFAVTNITAGESRKVTVAQNYPSSQTAWTVEAYEATSIVGSWTLTAYAICGVA